jgi:hypothetical protein
MSRSARPFCQDDRGAVGRSRIPMAARRRVTLSPYEASPSRMKYWGAYLLRSLHRHRIAFSVHTGRPTHESRDLRHLFQDPTRPDAAARRRGDPRQLSQPQERKGQGYPQAKLKAHLRRIGARTIDALWKANGDICALYSEQECRNYLKEAGYAPINRSEL